MSTISEDTFMDEYRPVELEFEGEFTLHSFKDAMKLAEKNGGDVTNVWTIIDGDEDDSLYAASGFHKVNETGFLVTEKPWVTGLEEAVWMDGDNFERDDED